MENRKRYYLVSFGDSRVYRLAYNDDNGSRHNGAPFVRVEKELNDYLNKEFPGGTFAYFTTPKVTEISPAHEAAYRDYPELDSKAVDDIKHLLRREVETMESVRMDNDNAIYSETD